MTMDDLFAFRRVADPQISPDGRHVVYVVSTVDLAKNTTSANLWMAPCPSASPSQDALAGAGADRNGTYPLRETMEGAVCLTRTDKKDLHPRWSPDGRFILFDSNRSGSMQLWVIGVSGGEAVQLTHVASGANTGTWSPSGKAIAFTSGVYPEYSSKPFSESDPLNQKRLDEAEKNPVKARVFSRLFFRHWDSYVEDRRQHLLVCEFDPASMTAGQPRDVTPGDRDAYPTSTTFSVGDDFCFSPDGTHLVFTAVPARHEAWDTDHDLCRVPVEGGTGDWQKLGRFAAAEGAPVFSPDGRQLAFRAQSRAGYEADKWSIYTVDTDPAGAWTAPPRNLTRDLDRSAESVHWCALDGAPPRIAFLCQENGRMVWYTTGDRGFTPHREATSVDALSFDRAGHNYVFLGSRLNQPPEVFAGSGGSAVCVSNANTARVEEIDWGSVESVAVPGADNVPMQMWIITPPGFDPTKRWPLAFLVHGGPQGAWMDSWSFRWNPELWAAQGYVVALPNPRGSTGFGQKYTDEISGDWGGKCYDDLMAGLAGLEAKPYIDSARMFAAGASFGGYMVNWFQGKTDKFRTLITHCGVFNFDSMYATTEELWFDEYEHGGPPWGAERHAYEAHSPHRLAAHFRTPMLIIHNDLDFRVPVSEGLQLFTTLQRRGVPSKMINFPDEGHWVLKPANSRFWHEQIFDWLRKYCPPGPA